MEEARTFGAISCRRSLTTMPSLHQRYEACTSPVVLAVCGVVVGMRWLA